MTKAELLATARIVLDDTVVPYLWSDAELTTYLQDAEQEAAERADLIPVEGVSTYCTVNVVAGTASYAINALVYKINKAWLTGLSFSLKRTSRQEKDRQYGELSVWESDTGDPTEFIFEANSIRLYPTPTANTTLYLVVNRLPITPMGTSPEINARHHRRMLDWVYRLAFLKRDTETFDPQKAVDYERMFEESFGPKVDMRVLTRHQMGTATEMVDASD